MCVSIDRHNAPYFENQNTDIWKLKIYCNMLGISSSRCVDVKVSFAI